MNIRFQLDDNLEYLGVDRALDRLIYMVTDKKYTLSNSDKEVIWDVVFTQIEEHELDVDEYGLHTQLCVNSIYNLMYNIECSIPHNYTIDKIVTDECSVTIILIGGDLDSS